MKDPVSNCLVNQIKSKQNKNKLARFFYFPLLLGCEVLLGTEAKVVVRERCYIPPVPFQLMHRQSPIPYINVFFPSFSHYGSYGSSIFQET